MADDTQARYRPDRCRTVSEASHGGYTLLIRCKACGHRRIVDPAPLWRLVRVKMWGDDLVAVGKHVRCGRCRARFPEIRASSEPADGLSVVGIETAEEAAKAAQRMRG